MRQLETPRLTIREFTMEDAEDLHKILGDDETMLNCEPAYDFEQTKAFLESFCIGKRGAVAAMERVSQSMIGYLLFNETEPGVFELGWIFNRNHWRQGYAYEACKALVNFAFEEENAHKVFAETIDGVKSVGLMKKLGMKFEGIQRNQTKDSTGKWADLYFYGLLREEWDQR